MGVLTLSRPLSSFAENGIFATRLREAMKSRGENQTTLSKKVSAQLGVDVHRQSISQYMNGQSKPDTERLTAICKILDCSADYLLGLSEVQSINPKIRSIAKYTGLTESALKYLHELVKVRSMPGCSDDNRLALLSALFSAKTGDPLIAHLVRYVELLGMEQDRVYPGSGDYVFHLEELQKHGYTISTPADQAQLLLDGRIRDLARSILDEISRKWKTAPGADTPGADAGQSDTLPSQDSIDGRK